MKFIFFILISVFISACTCSGGRNQTDWEPITDMAQQKNIKPQEGSDKGEMLQRLPPEGARARNRSYYPYKNPLEAGDKLKNPLQLTADVLEKGQLYYTRYCIYCHGTKGDGKEGATVVPRMSFPPPSLLTAKAKAYSDGHIYHIIYSGQGLMGAYHIQLGSDEQTLTRYMQGQSPGYRGFESIWSVINYVRFLQNSSDTGGK